MSDARLPAHLEIAGLIRAVEAAGGFAAVICKGERDVGSILIVTIENGRNQRLWERMPRLDGRRAFAVSRSQDADKAKEFTDYLARRTAQDPDAWLLELDIPNPERLIADTLS